jgi:hypothetical protein
VLQSPYWGGGRVPLEQLESLRNSGVHPGRGTSTPPNRVTGWDPGSSQGDLPAHSTGSGYFSTGLGAAGHQAKTTTDQEIGPKVDGTRRSVQAGNWQGLQRPQKPGWELKSKVHSYSRACGVPGWPLHGMCAVPKVNATLEERGDDCAVVLCRLQLGLNPACPLSASKDR